MLKAHNYTVVLILKIRKYSGSISLAKYILIVSERRYRYHRLV